MSSFRYPAARTLDWRCHPGRPAKRLEHYQRGGRPASCSAYAARRPATSCSHSASPLTCTSIASTSRTPHGMNGELFDIVRVKVPQGILQVLQHHRRRSQDHHPQRRL